MNNHLQYLMAYPYLFMDFYRHHKGQIVSMARLLGCPLPADNRLGGLFT